MLCYSVSFLTNTACWYLCQSHVPKVLCAEITQPWIALYNTIENKAHERPLYRVKRAKISPTSLLCSQRSYTHNADKLRF
jgi:hypothetical protein